MKYKPCRLFASALTAIAFLFISFMAIAPQASGAPAEGEELAVEESMSVIEIIIHGGPLIIMVWIVILLTSIIMVTLVIQNFITLRVPKLAPPAMVGALRETINSGNYQEAWQICDANSNYVANVLKSGLERIGRGKDIVEAGIAEHGLREAQLIRTRNSYLSVIGVVAPMIGLLGTVIGMMGAFATLGSQGISDPRALSTSIGEVLLATASGLAIAIPAFVFYYVFRNMSQTAIVHSDDIISNLLGEIPYDELSGVRIGETFSAGEGAETFSAKQSRKVSMALTTNCPVCNGAVTPGQNPCPHCGSTLEWAN